MKLDPGEAERIAAVVAERLRDEPPPRFVDAATLARLLGVEREWVYEHAEELGAVRLGGPRGRLRFDQLALAQRLAEGEDQALAQRLAPSTMSRASKRDRGARSRPPINDNGR